MATLDFLPQTVYSPPPPVQVRRQEKSLNTIMEEDSRCGSFTESPQELEEHFLGATWRSPTSGNFPTPRGNHFMLAPQLPSEPSSASSSRYSETSLPWTRDSISTNTTEFDDLYDVSDDERKRKKISLLRSKHLHQSAISTRLSSDSVASHTSLPSLVIPQSPARWPSFKYGSPVPPTPPPKIPMSPALFSYLASRDIPSSSTPPSLDGSLTSEQMAAMSAPATPDLGNDETTDGNSWGGVQLQPGAMATLHALSGGDDAYGNQQVERVIDFAPPSPTREMQQSPPPVFSNIRRHHSVVLPAHQQRALESLSRLDIPSPGGFFSNLSEESRTRWRFEPIVPEADNPPSSTTAEHFYKTPWAQPVTRYIEVSDTMSDGLPTARPTLLQIDSDETVMSLHLTQETDDEACAVTELIVDPDYTKKLQQSALENVDRTNVWLKAQTTFIESLINPPEERSDEDALQKRDAEVVEAARSIVEASPARKTVRFSEIITTETKLAIGAPRPRPFRQESAYYRAFLGFVSRSRFRDTYVHRLPRFEALQAQRIAFPEAHRNQLLGKYQLSVVPQSAKKRMSANVARGDETPLDNPLRIKADKEREALAQMSGVAWTVMATKMLNGGRLIAAPVAKRLARLTSMGPKLDGGVHVRERARILDLGGQGACDWAWHCAFEYPNVKVYTTVTKAARQIANSNIRGPRNHRQVAVEKLTKLPFATGFFDLISARNLYMLLKIASVHGEDEYEACFAECFRVLKPGGYLEFQVLDSDIMHSGPLGEAESVEFGFNLKTRGYDPSPTKSWISRLRKTGFEDVKRAWMFLPMGSPTVPVLTRRDSVGREVKLELEAMVLGKTNNVSSITGLLGSWAWERWMLKLQMEMGLKEESLLEGSWAVFEEGRKLGAGWRSLNGWARKPL